MVGFNLYGFPGSPSIDPESNKKMLKQQFLAKRSGDRWEDYFLTVNRLIGNDVVSELVPLHISEYYKPPTKWLFHGSGLV